MKIVCDTNILISALIFPGGAPEQVLNLARLKMIRLYLSPEILTEFQSVLARKFRYPAKEAEMFIERLTSMAEIVYPTHRLHRISRIDADNRILECAEAAEADFLITGDRRDLLPLGSQGRTQIVTARAFLTIWQQTE